jgi:hypothetical protein
MGVLGGVWYLVLRFGYVSLGFYWCVFLYLGGYWVCGLLSSGYPVIYDYYTILDYYTIYDYSVDTHNLRLGIYGLVLVGLFMVF